MSLSRPGQSVTPGGNRGRGRRIPLRVRQRCGSTQLKAYMNSATIARWVRLPCGRQRSGLLVTFPLASPSGLDCGLGGVAGEPAPRNGVNEPLRGGAPPTRL